MTPVSALRAVSASSHFENTLRSAGYAFLAYPIAPFTKHI